METEKIKVLWLSDFNCSTGFAQVAHNILDRLAATGKYDFTIVGINHHGEPYDFKRWPYKIYPARNLFKFKDPRYMDLFGRQRFLDELGTGTYDIAFSLQDTFVMEEIGEQVAKTKEALIRAGRKPFTWIYYYPVDGKLKENWVEKSVAFADIPVTYTEFAKEETLKINKDLNIEVIYHGVDTKMFKPLGRQERKDFRKRYFEGQAEGRYLVTNLNRNQRRKDIPRTIAAFAEFKKKREDALLYLHMRSMDVGGNVMEMARHYGLRPIKDFVVPAEFDENKGYPIEVVNKIYNASDVVISTTLGEGWGLSSTEAMATKTPIIFPDNTALTEICADGRGLLVKSGANVNAFINLGDEDMCQYRPLTDITDMADKLCYAYDHRDEMREMAEKAYTWVKQLDWDIICQQWNGIFDRAYSEQQELWAAMQPKKKSPILIAK